MKYPVPRNPIGNLAPMRRRQAVPQEEGYSSFTASELYCPKCRRAMPVREKLLLVLPSGELFDFICTGCGSSLGSKTT